MNEADPASLTELMARDPLELTKSDIRNIVAQLREQRKVFEAADTAKKQKPMPAKKNLSQAEKQALLQNLELDL